MEPGNVFLILFVGGVILLWTRWFRVGRVAVLAAALIAVFVATIPVGGVFIAHLENRFAPPRPMPDRVDGIILLADGVRRFIGDARRAIPNGAGERRITELTLVVRNYPDARLLVSEREPFESEAQAAQTIAEFLRLQGVESPRVDIESGTRNAYAQAAAIHRLLNPKPQETWILMTAASSMPRAMGAFRKTGWHVLPYPVDFVTTGNETLRPTLNILGGWGLLRRAISEGLALGADRLMGRADTLIPGAAT